MKFFVAILCAAVPAAGFSQILSAAPAPNNGTGGVYMNLTPAAQNLTVTSFDTFFGATSGGAFTVEIWTRPGSYVGFSNSNAGWTLFDTVGGTSVNDTTLASFALNNALFLTAGQTTGVLVHSTTAGNGLRYNGTGALPPTTTWSNADLTMFSDRSHTGATPFGGSEFSPRTFAGNVHYSLQPVPEPATLVALGFGALALLRRRKKA